MRRSFLLERTDLEVSRAKEYGDVVVLFDRPLSEWEPNLDVELSQTLDDLKFDPEQDAFIVAGKMNTLAYLLSVVAAEYGAINLLLYSKNHGYLPKKVQYESEPQTAV